MDVTRRRKGRVLMPLGLVALTLVLLYVAPTATAGSDRHFAIAAGKGWSLTGWHGNGGLCLSYATLERGISSHSSKCGFGRPHDTVAAWWQMSPKHRLNAVVGVVRAKVARVTVGTESGRQVNVRLFAEPKGLGVGLRFFRAAVPTHASAFLIHAYDARGTLIG